MGVPPPHQRRDGIPGGRVGGAAGRLHGLGRGLRNPARSLLGTHTLSKLPTDQ